MVRQGLISIGSLRRGYRRAGVVLRGVIASVALVACGGSNDNNDSSDTGAASTTAATTGGGGGETVRVSETEYKLDPSDASVKAGEVTFDVTNDGTTLHNLEVDGPGEEAKTDDLQPGSSGTVTVDLSKPGTYEMYCTIDGHRDLGMEGKVTVTG